MAAPVDFKPIRLTQADERQGRKQMRDMLGRDWWRKRGRAAWAGFAAEDALQRAINASGQVGAEPYPTRACDLLLTSPGCASMAVEVKTRATSSGWVHPEKFDYITVPMHDGREPIKKEAQLVVFCWYSMDDPRCLWVLGVCRGLDEFKRRSTWYAEGDPLPRGGWAKDGGAYVIEVKQLRPMPDALLQELQK